MRISPWTQIPRKSTRTIGLKLGLFFALATPFSAFADDLTFYDNAKDGSPLVDRIKSAHSSIDIEIYEMNDQTVQSALLDAARSGVKVRIVLETSPVGKSCRIFTDPILSTAKKSTPPTALDTECDAMKIFKADLEKAGGEMIPFSKALCGDGSGTPTKRVDTTTTSCLQHGKMVLIDRGEALISTGNFNPSSFCNIAEKPKGCNRDFTLSILKRDAIDNLQTVFELDWVGAPYDIQHSLPKNAFETITVSPFSMDPLIDFIASSTTSLQVTAQYLKDPTMNAAILKAAKSGVKVEILVASFCSFGKPSDSEARKVKMTYRSFEVAGATVRAFPSAVRVNGRPGYMHAKAIIVNGARAWVGSVNGSTQSLTRNREFGMFFSDATPLAKLSANFAADVADPNTESWQESVACKKDRTSGGSTPEDMDDR